MTKNTERAAATRTRLIAVARDLFARDGFAGTATEAILDGAGVKRGALYHHFADKAALFEAVCVALSEEATAAIEAAALAAPDSFGALVEGSRAWLAFVTRPGVRQILVVDAPTVLGWERWNELDQRLGAHSLKLGVAAAIADGTLIFDGDPAALATMLNGALNALALRVGAGRGAMSKADAWRAIEALLSALRRRA